MSEDRQAGIGYVRLDQMVEASLALALFARPVDRIAPAIMFAEMKSLGAFSPKIRKSQTAAVVCAERARV